MKKDNSQTRWERKQRKELLEREQEASCNTWYDKMNFYIRDFSFEKFLKETFGAKKGFTLIELGVCVAIIAVLVVISLPIYLDILAKSKEAAAAILKLTNGQ
jgi:prepilin-type N-terminal cleavage/methylation domain-containing protein